MPVQLIVDCFDIDTEDAIVIDRTEEVNDLRLRVHQHLAEKNPALLRIRLKHLALVKHFKTFDGMVDFLPIKTIEPRVILGKKLNQALPQWLLNEWIIKLGLLNYKNFNKENSDSFEIQFLAACDTTILNSKDFQSFISAIQKQPAIFVELLEIETIKTLLIGHLMDLNISKNCAELFISELIQGREIQPFLENLAYQHYLSQLRQKIREYSLNFALPAQSFSVDLLNELPFLQLLETSAKQLPDDLINIIRMLVRKISYKEIDAKALADFVFADWESVWFELNTLCDELPVLFTQELLKSCQFHTSTQAQSFSVKVQNYLAVSHYRPLSENASVEETLDWSVGYFKYCRSAFLSKQPLDETINTSFTQWLISQTSRIGRSDSDWRFCSTQIQSFLDSGYLVVVTVIDALSALNQDILLDELKTIDHLTVISDTLFAPFPTLTEIGKMAVLTGKQTHSLPNNSENALQQTYQTPLQIIKSWEDASERINDQTNLVVFFENRIDERLHAATSFEKHRADIKPIVRQLKSSIQSWLKDAAHRDVIFFITADHGMTVTNGRYSGSPLGETKDRVFKLTHNETLPNDFVRINQDSKDDYAIPLTRMGLTDNLLTHGGLTPEEVLIPFIKLVRTSLKENNLPIEVEIIGDCLRLNDKFWQLDFKLTASIQVETIRLNLELPFELEHREVIDIIRAQKSHNVTVKFRSNIEQEGLVALNLGLQFERAGARETIKKALTVNFPVSFLAYDGDVQNFEDMF